MGLAMKNEDKYTKLVVKLNRLTKEDKLSWRKSKPPAALSEGVDTSWVDFYTTCYADTELGIGEARYREYSNMDDEYYWLQRVVLALLDGKDLLYEFPKIEGLWNLLETIRYNLADVESTVDHLIGAPDIDEE
jgi:hypothetical protein